MADSNDSNQEEEYHFSELGGGPTAGQSTGGNIYGTSSSKGGAANLISRLPKKNILILIGVIVVIVFAYKLIGVFFSAHSNEHKQVKKQQTHHVVVPTQVAYKPEVSNKSLQQQLANVSSTQTKQLMSSIKDLTESINSVQNQLNSVNYTLQQLTNDVDQQHQLLAAMNKAHRAKSKAKRNKMVKKVLPSYYVKATIPGRAWLIGKGGRTLTVEVGSPLKGYGWVRQINSNTGVVVTSSGHIVTYNPKDS